MSQSGVAAFDSTMQITNVWLHDIMDRLGWRERLRAYHALRAVLHALRDRLQVDQAAALGAQLPMLIRGIYYEGWHPHGKPLKERKKEEFLAHIGKELRGTLEGEPETIARVVFQVLAKHMTPGEIKHINLSMPHELRDLWSPETHTLWFQQ